jgi:cellulase/cellobiase CelA1
MSYRTKVAVLVAALLAAFAVAGPARATPTPDGLCDVATGATQWTGGYQMTVSIRNIATRPVTWRANVQVPPPGYIIQGWGAYFLQSGENISIYPPPYPGGLIQPGQTYYFGYVGTGPVVYPVVTCS